MCVNRVLIVKISILGYPGRTILSVSGSYTGRKNTDRTILKISRIRPCFYSIRRRIRLYFKDITVRISAPGIQTVSLDRGGSECMRRKMTFFID
jgi:hypothetical protein